MLHICTVHWNNPDWLMIQKGYLDKFAPQPYLMYTMYSGFDLTPEQQKEFYYCEKTSEASHPAKLNKLADRVVGSADPTDPLLFVDNDAFPIGDVSYLLGYLKKHPLIAIQRVELNGQPTPHPSFCLTTVGFWKSLKSGWGVGAKPYIDSTGQEVRDTGTALYWELVEKKVNWLPLLRTSGLTDHPVLFSIYDGSIYHHGAGSRPPRTRWDLIQSDPQSQIERNKADSRLLASKIKSGEISWFKSEEQKQEVKPIETKPKKIKKKRVRQSKAKKPKESD